MKQLTIEQLLHELGSKNGKYTGGTGIGLVSVLSATLTQFIFELQLGKKKYIKDQAQLEQIIEHAKQLSDEFLRLTEEDSTVFEQVLSAYKMPKISTEEKELRQQAIDNGYVQSSLPLLNIMRNLVELLDLYEQLIDLQVSGPILSDALMSVQFIQAAAVSAERMIENNLYEVKQSEKALPIQDALIQTKQKLNKKIKKVTDAIESYLKYNKW
ncbi:cyclodeaminase/cyclohydrolase family protein [Allofustis seminis]|uniref:cyclodeaminase/cyclohydrolase family protein n=1 Tax=Allofustis seminis TaxID=166939 RepID=UPI00035F59A4|nr:cyclodeaminase/cyclohydrolase family protein [Allofustis seminis]